MEAKYGEPVIPGRPLAGRGGGGGARASPSQPVIPKGSIFEKLTDSSQYTGSHKERFDEQGQGKGLAGRDFTPTGGGTTFQAPHSPGAAAFKGDTNAKTDTVFKDSSEFLVRR